MSRHEYQRLFRLLRKERLAARWRGALKRATKTRAPMLAPMCPSGRCSLGFACGRFTKGRFPDRHHLDACP